jgi:hypothetical protein
MNKHQAVELSQLTVLQESLPDRTRAATRAVAHAELRLAEILTLRAAGQSFRRSEIAGARMALDRALRDAEDLQRIEAVLPELIAGQRGRSVRLVPI